jgi:hypothetical protein
MATKEDLKAFATRSEMLLLHEDLVERIKTLDDAFTRPRSRARKQ